MKNEKEFKATHVITVRYCNGVTESTPVRRDGDSLYTEPEWNACDAADWTVEDGNLLFQGQVPRFCAAYVLTSVSEVSLEELDQENKARGHKSFADYLDKTRDNL